jgi:hypothetical protein
MNWIIIIIIINSSSISSASSGISLLNVREEHRLRVFENRVLRRIFGPKREEGSNRRLKKTAQRGAFIICTLHKILLGWSNQR